MQRTRSGGALPGRVLLCCAALFGVAPAVQAGWFDSLTGGGQQSEASSRQRLWPIREFTRIELVARESGSPPNDTPISIEPDTLRQQLALVRFEARGGARPLFDADELGLLVGPLAQALGRAGPNDDVLLLSGARREGDFFVSPTAVTARLFVQGGQLQFIVHDARMEFYDTYRGTNTAPKFTFGSRTQAATVTLQSAGATSPRPDWLSIALRAPAPALAPAGTSAAPAAQAPQAAPAPAARRPLDAGMAEDIERRLETLKRLREKNLITEDEYQQKRKEILQLL